MHTNYARINNISASLSTCMMALLAAVALSSFLFTARPAGDLAIATVKVLPGNTRRYANKHQEFAFVDFNVTADLSSLFNWNTKQLFLYLGAEYTNKQGPFPLLSLALPKAVTNEVVIWDKIIRNKEDAHLDVASRNKYVFRDLSTSFRGVPPANYTLKYNVMPYVGLLTYGEAARTLEPVEFPAQHQL